MCDSRGGVIASSQCSEARKYAIAPVGSTDSIRNGMTTTSFATARSTSRTTCRDPFAAPETTTTMRRVPSMACRIASPHNCPGTMSRGATQHRIPACSRRDTMASATGLSLVE